MSTAKPICVIHLTDSLGDGGKQISWEDCRIIQEINEREKPDYYWFVIPGYNLDTVKFQVFYEKDFTEIEYAELKKIIEDAIESQNKKPLQ